MSEQARRERIAAARNHAKRCRLYAYLPQAETWDELADALERIEALEKALREIKNRENQVCANFEVCAHLVCHASYEAFAIADKALEAP